MKNLISSWYFVIMKPVIALDIVLEAGNLLGGHKFLTSSLLLLCIPFVCRLCSKSQPTLFEILYIFRQYLLSSSEIYSASNVISFHLLWTVWLKDALFCKAELVSTSAAVGVASSPSTTRCVGSRRQQKRSLWPRGSGASPPQRTWWGAGTSRGSAVHR